MGTGTLGFAMESTGGEGPAPAELTASADAPGASPRFPFHVNTPLRTYSRRIALSLKNHTLTCKEQGRELHLPPPTGPFPQCSLTHSARPDRIPTSTRNRPLSLSRWSGQFQTLPPPAGC